MIVGDGAVYVECIGSAHASFMHNENWVKLLKPSAKEARYVMQKCCVCVWHLIAFDIERMLLLEKVKRMNMNAL